jgi:uncharacterized protein
MIRVNRRGYLPILLPALALNACAARQSRPVEPLEPSAADQLTLAPLIDGFVRNEETRCLWGLANKCEFVGRAYHLGIGVPPDQERAVGYFQRACSLGSADGCAMSGVMIVELGDKARFADVLTIWERACDSGSAFGCHSAGVALAVDSHGLGVPRDVPRGRAYLAKACAARYIPSCSVNSMLVFELKETEKYAAARQQLVKSCELRERETCHWLALSELDGTFGKKDERAAGHYLGMACAEDWAPSCSALAYVHAKGIGTPVNADKAKQLTTRACVLKYQPACEALRHPERGVPAP